MGIEFGDTRTQHFDCWNERMTFLRTNCFSILFKHALRQKAQAKAVELSGKLQESRKTEHIVAHLTVVANDTLSAIVRKLE